MKRPIVSSIPIALLSLFCMSSMAENCDRLVATGHPGYPPLVWAEGATLGGVPPRLVQKLGTEAGAKVEIVNLGSWEKALAAVRSGDVDAMAGVYFNDERAGWYDFVYPAYLQDPVSVIVARERPFNFSKREDLVGRKGLANKAESYGADLDRFISEKLSVARVDGLPKAFEELLAGRADYVINGTFPALNVAIERGIKERIQVLQPPLTSEGVFIAFSKKSPCRNLATDFGKRIQQMVQSGDVDRMVEQATRDWQKNLAK